MTIAFESFSAAHDTRLSADDIFDIQNHIKETSEKIRTGEIDGKLRKTTLHNLGDYAILLANSDAPAFMKASTLTMAAANTGSIELRNMALTQLGVSYPTDAHEVPSSDIRKFNEEAQQEHVAAMLLTDKSTPYAAALQKAEQYIDFINGRDYEADVMIPTETAGLKLRREDEKNAQLEKRRQELRDLFADDLEPDDAPYDPFADDNEDLPEIELDIPEYRFNN